jgi:hypothetical protein
MGRWPERCSLTGLFRALEFSLLAGSGYQRSIIALTALPGDTLHGMT